MQPVDWNKIAADLRRQGISAETPGEQRTGRARVAVVAPRRVAAAPAPSTQAASEPPAPVQTPPDAYTLHVLELARRYQAEEAATVRVLTAKFGCPPNMQDARTPAERRDDAIAARILAAKFGTVGTAPQS